MSVFFVFIPVPSTPEPATETPAGTESENGILMDAEKTADYLGISVETLRKVGFPFVQLTPGGRRFYRREDLQKYIEGATVHPRQEIQRKANRISRDLVNGAVSRALRNAKRRRAS